MSNHRTYATVATSDIENVDFSLIYEDSAETIRKSIDESLFILKWPEDSKPLFITDGSVTVNWSGSHEEALDLMHTPAWTNADGE